MTKQTAAKQRHANEVIRVQGPLNKALCKEVGYVSFNFNGVKGSELVSQDQMICNNKIWLI